MEAAAAVEIAAAAGDCSLAAAQAAAEAGRKTNALLTGLIRR
jgi:hypothetical protein